MNNSKKTSFFVFNTMILVNLLCLFSNNMLAREAKENISYYFQSNNNQTEMRNNIYVPEDLKPWVEWVTYKYPDFNCADIDNIKACVWPSFLELNIEKNYSNFIFYLSLDHSEAIALPGNKGAWPVNVKINNNEYPVLEENSKPIVWLNSGNYTITGSFNLGDSIDRIALPKNLALLKVIENNIENKYPERDTDGAVLLKQPNIQKEKKQNSLSVEVFRLIEDTVPLTVTTKIITQVAGELREINFGNVNLKGSIPILIEGAMPARINNDGDLLVQLIPGANELTIKSVYSNNINAINTVEAKEPWPEIEYWAISLNENIRVASISGMQGIDAGRTNIFEDWRKFPIYVAKKGDILSILESSRGESSQKQNQILLNREIWIDNLGRGMSVLDKFQGQMFQSWKLESIKPLVVTRAINNSENVLVAKDEKDNFIIPIRSSEINIEIESRIEGLASNINAIGWNTPVEKLQTTINTPPGWELMAVFGADRQSAGAMLEQWDISDICFMILLLSLSYYILGLKMLPIAFLAFFLSKQHSYSPEISWLAFFVSTIILNKTKKMSLQNYFMERIQVFFAIILYIMIIIYAFDSIKFGTFPILEKPYTNISFEMESGGSVSGSSKPSVNQPLAENNSYDSKESNNLSKREQIQYAMPSQKMASSVKKDISQEEHQNIQQEFQQDEQLKINQGSQQKGQNDLIQTGEGIPNWKWKKYELYWNGAVSTKQNMDIYLLSPFGKFLWHLVSALSSVFLGLALIKKIPMLTKILTTRIKATSFIFKLLLLSLLFNKIFSVNILLANAISETPSMANADFQLLLNELEQRLIKPPYCGAKCFSISKNYLEIEKYQFKLEQEINVLYNSAVPLPGPIEELSITDISVNGKKQYALMKNTDGVVYIRLKPGVHKVIIKGNLSNRPITIQYKSSPQYFVFNSTDWQITGLHDDHTIDNSIHIQPKQTLLPTNDSSLIKTSSSIVNTWVQVDRFINIGTSFKTKTVAHSWNIPDSPFTIKIPIIKGESVIGSNIQIEDNFALLTFDRENTSITWDSIIKNNDGIINNIKLEFLENAKWTESWSILCSSMYECKYNGITPIKNIDNGFWNPLWLPFPKESISVDIKKLKSAPGQYTTIDNLKIHFTPKERISETTMNFSLRSSQTGLFKIILPENIKIKKISIDNADQSIRLKKGTLELTMKTGNQNVDISWQEDYERAFLTQLPKIIFPIPVSNISISMGFDAKRWIVYIYNSSWGPVSFLWFFILLPLFLAPLLKNFKFIPLKLIDWFFILTMLILLNPFSVITFVAWFVAIESGSKKDISGKMKVIYLLFLLFITLSVFNSFYSLIINGLNNLPPSYIKGNDSNSFLMKWFQDRSKGAIESPLIVSIPSFVWRGLVVLWSVWLLYKLTRWLPFVWSKVSHVLLNTKKTIDTNIKGGENNAETHNLDI